MPTYEYLCRHCGHTFEEFQSMTEEPLVRCPKCGTDALARVMGTGGGVIFKGSGFYLTDYKKKDEGKGTAPKGKPASRGGDPPPATSPPAASPPEKKD
ncbi:MAG TPA: zinc ribbon domain-containing protein [Bacteroidota bacterium]|nr:zinc ribbon domain-containing protein [Bacteroidota bacterium]